MRKLHRGALPGAGSVFWAHLTAHSGPNRRNLRGSVVGLRLRSSALDFLERVGARGGAAARFRRAFGRLRGAPLGGCIGRAFGGLGGGVLDSA